MTEGQTGFFRGQWKQDGIFVLCARMILGAVFIYASIDKIVHPEAFAKAVYNYQILPDALINLTAIILPWLELLLGICLVLGACLPGVVFLSNMLLATFLGALVFNLSRGLDTYCGCFSTLSAASSINIRTVLRDASFLILSLYLLFVVFFKKPSNVSERINYKPS